MLYTNCFPADFLFFLFPFLLNQNYDEMLAQSKAMRRGAGVGPQAAPSGFR